MISGFFIFNCPNRKVIRKIKIIFHGHSVIGIELKNKQKLLFSPFIRENGPTVLKAEPVKTDYIFITHGHHDHIGDIVEIAKK